MATIANENTKAICTCSITGEIMIDPVTTKNGQTYERSAIEEWLRTHNTDPNTGSTLHDKNTYTPNYAIKSVCEQLRTSSNINSSSEKKEQPEISFTPPNTTVSYHTINVSNTHTTRDALVTI